MSKIYTPYNSLFLITILFLIAIGAFTTCTAEEISSSRLIPVKVIDGDSLEIGNARIRLMGIDAPEYLQYCKNAQQKKYPCGKQATEYLKKLIDNGPITCKSIRKDQYDRDLCTCYKEGLNLNAEMVRSGHAVAYMESNYHQEENEAKQHKRGLWQGRFMQPRLFRQLNQQQKQK